MEKYQYEGSSIQRWDLDHGIVTVRKNDCEYRVCRDWQGFLDKCEAEKEQDFRRIIAAQQDEAYMGGQ